MSTHMTPARLALAATLSACLLGTSAMANEITHPVEHMATETTPARQISGTQATLRTDSKGATMILETRELTPGHVTTAWWVIMNNAPKCSATPCTPEDVIARADLVGTQIVYADGAVNSPEGTALFTAYLPAGTVENGWYAQDFPNPQTAEIHLVLNDHGPLVPELAASMLTSYRGGCSDESLPPPFPGTAKADGLPGPNQCRLIQDAIFVQPANSTN